MQETKWLVQEHLARMAAADKAQEEPRQTLNREERRLQQREWKRQQRHNGNRNKGSLLRK